ncbi:hypothetical protein COR50_13065 [Chitinophaga caeni]|uniref:Activator of Hsp90 ATPase homologue 1/2-like C-terminal domain-containing protein n=1 Tax=Chitinophaga caeni TaxID=2029983 RepID=A0A291QVR9_9BACT|nr:SRPBCC domain-containing protein [Chitinophaga caeni]ATL48021.1 hypothetical protein COR50_13065 [Chitinophaga caeni]
MEQSKYITNNISINATAEEVWDALVNPLKTRQYMFGCETVSDWKVGSELRWRGKMDGKEIDFVTGYIVSIDPPSKLVYTVFDPLSDMEDIPENHLTVTYDLITENGATTLTVTQGDYSKVANGEKRYADSYNNGEGWMPVLKAIKDLVENG